MKKKMLKHDWLEKLHYDLHTDIAAGNPYENASQKTVDKLFNKVTSQLHGAFKGTDIKFRGKDRQTDIYAEAYRLIIGLNTSTQNLFDKDFNIKESVLESKVVNFEQRYVYKRLKNMANAYDEVRTLLVDYLMGNMTLNELTDEIEDFKKTNSKYLAQDYKAGYRRSK